ncbi:hypothetical protein C8J55DRAFT_156155 [Lentinula edodes]|uniref:Uncharacterized protein n=1 Tax=Lentinula lateritia TaxID=40482 RepID=A0A9W9DHR9_9AGAR|nr:hypothetical protein C8J55DRAFT_156155 [Lentinula edodes]
MRSREVLRDRHRPIRRRYSRDIPQLPTQQPLVPPPASPYPLSPLVFVQSAHMDSPSGGADPNSHPHPQTGSGMPVPVYGVTPMYMSILPGMPPPPTGSGVGIGESSPPGFAGRGAGGGYGAGYGVQGYAGTAPPGSGAYTYGYAYPYAPSQSPPPPPQVHHNGDTRKSPLNTAG